MSFSPFFPTCNPLSSQNCSNGSDLCSAGTASVIIALTDGELNEWQFDTAQREVRRDIFIHTFPMKFQGFAGLSAVSRTMD